MFCSTVRCGRERQLLVDHRDAERPVPRADRVGAYGCPAERHPARVGGMAPERIFISVLLPAPFSPTSACTSPGCNIEIDAAQRDHRAEPLLDAAHRQRCRVAGLTDSATSRGPGDSSALMSGCDMFSRVTIVAPVSTRFSTGFPATCRAASSRRAHPCGTGSGRRGRRSCRRSCASVSLVVASKPTNFTLPLRLAASRAQQHAECGGFVRAEDALHGLVGGEQVFRGGHTRTPIVAPPYWLDETTLMPGNFSASVFEEPGFARHRARGPFG